MKKLPLTFRVAAACAAAFLLATLPAAAQANASPPERMTYQGYLVDGNGEALGQDAPKNYDVIFRIWKSESSTASADLLWMEQQTVTVDKGYFSVLLGEGSNIGEPRPALSTVFAGGTASERWVGITVKGIGSGGADADILPRLRLLSAPYAYLAQRAVTVDGSALTSGTVADSRLSPNVALRNAPNTFTGNQTFAAGSLTLDNNQAIWAKNSSGTPEIFVWPRYGDNVTYLNYGSGGLHIRNNSSATRMFITDTGNIGIGMATPGFPLNFSGSLGDKISLWGQSGNHFGFGIAPSTLLIHTDVAASDIAFGHGRYGAMTEVMRIKGNGLIGIGTSNPGNTLQINSTFIPASGFGLAVSDPDFGASIQISRPAGQGGLGLVVDNAANGDGASYLMMLRNNMSATPQYVMSARSDGRVGIGVQDPVAALHVKGTRVSASGAMNWFRYEFPDNAPTRDGDVAGQTIAYFDGQVVSSDAICSMLSPSFSDARAKIVLGRSPGAEDLRRLDSIQVTDFRWIDDAHGKVGVQKKVIAQEVEQILPSAVSRMTKAVPSVYANASAVSWDSRQRTLSLGVEKSHGFQVGDKVEVYTDQGDLSQAEVLETPSAGTFVVRCEFEPKKAFVYGKWVNDYRVVDYDAIAMLNVSATQELHRRLEAQARETLKLAETAEDKSRRVQALESEVSALRQQLVLQSASIEKLLARHAERDSRLVALERALLDQQTQLAASPATSGPRGE